MDEQNRDEAITDIDFRLLSAATLSKKLHKGISIDELYNDAERKFDTLIDILNGTYTEFHNIRQYEYSLNDLKEASFLIFHRLIFNTDSNPYMILCVSEDASLEKIKVRRNKLLHIFHPDRNSEEFNDGAEARKINEAYEIITNNYNTNAVRFKSIKINIPRYYPSKKKIKLILFSIAIIFLLAFIGFITKY